MEDTKSKQEKRKKKRQMNRKVWWGPINSKELAEFIVKETAKGFYVIAIIQAIIGLLFFPAVIVDAILFFLIAYWMAKTNSRVPAIILLILAVLSVIVTAGSRLADSGGGSNIVLAILMFWFSIRAVSATGFLAKKKGHSSTPSA